MMNGMTMQERMNLKVELLQGMKRAAEKRFCNAPDIESFKEADMELTRVTSILGRVTALALK